MTDYLAYLSIGAAVGYVIVILWMVLRGYFDEDGKLE
jgi:hypothetical protein